MGLVELRRIEASREVAGTLEKSPNVTYLPGGNNMMMALNPADVGGCWEGYSESEEPLLLSNLISADVSLDELPLTALYNAKFLTLLWVGYDDLPYQGIKSYDKAFQNLIQLELNGGILDWSDLLRLLQNCPNLQDFSISMTLTTNNDWKYPYNVPRCISSQLKKCRMEIYGVAGDDDFQFATYILKNARFLEDITIYVERYLNQAQKTKVLEDLTICTRISPTCWMMLLMLLYGLLEWCILFILTIILEIMECDVLRMKMKRKGSLYFWAAHLAGPKWGPFSSWCCAWLETIGLIAGIGTQVKGLIRLNFDSVFS
ncbi:unnamed protein product [Vicia faba]|uniref:FBD domain-containing protein n=1 Tax=Vicia faba TaxID=3906 RepID=A0AAV0YWI7_VICFA|nr:unnamed protein product [Vicia faba]